MAAFPPLFSFKKSPPNIYSCYLTLLTSLPLEQAKLGKTSGPGDKENIISPYIICDRVLKQAMLCCQLKNFSQCHMFFY